MTARDALTVTLRHVFVTLGVTERHTQGVAKSDAQRSREYRARRKASESSGPSPSEPLGFLSTGPGQALLAQVEAKAESTEVPFEEVVERLFTAYLDGKVNVRPRQPPAQPSPPQSAEPPDEIPPEPRSPWQRLAGNAEGKA